MVNELVVLLFSVLINLSLLICASLPCYQLLRLQQQDLPFVQLTQPHLQRFAFGTLHQT